MVSPDGGGGGWGRGEGLGVNILIIIIGSRGLMSIYRYIYLAIKKCKYISIIACYEVWVCGRSWVRAPAGAIVRRVFHRTRKLVRFSLLECPSIPNSKQFRNT